MGRKVCHDGRGGKCDVDQKEKRTAENEDGRINDQKKLRRKERNNKFKLTHPRPGRKRCFGCSTRPVRSLQLGRSVGISLSENCWARANKASRRRG